MSISTDENAAGNLLSDDNSVGGKLRARGDAFISAQYFRSATERRQERSCKRPTFMDESMLSTATQDFQKLAGEKCTP